MKLFNSIT